MIKYAALDLDRTLFKTDDFLSDISAIGAAMASLSQHEFISDSQQFRYLSKDNLSHYDFFAQLQHYGIEKNKQTIDYVTNTLRHAQKSYIYEDVSQFLVLLALKHYKIFVLTYGEDTYQRTKVSASEELLGVPVAVVLEHKRIHLTRTGGRGVLFDDAVQELLPNGWRSELIDRQVYPNDALIRLASRL